MGLPRVEPKPSEGIEYYPAGSSVAITAPGDFILTHGTAWTSKVIMLAESIRYHGKNKIFANWSHAAMVVGNGGELVEALGGGVTATNISKYLDAEYCYVRTVASPEDRVQMQNFANKLVGNKYGFLTLVAIGLGLITNLRLTFELSGREICSQATARMLERGTYIWEDPSTIMPADLARHFKVIKEK